MPTNPGAGESKDQFISRCIEHESGTGRSNEEAVAMCEAMWERGKSAGGDQQLVRAYSLLTVKNIDETRRTVTGIASTPTVDRMGDSVDPMGAKFKVPMPLLLYHDAERPVGTVDFATPGPDGIPFSASIPEVKEPGVVRDRVEEAMHSIKYKLTAAVSIGFMPEAGGIELMKSGGILYRAWEWLELSLCAVPANTEALILSFKSMDPSKIRKALSILPAGAMRLDQSVIRRALYAPGSLYLPQK